MTRYKKQSFRSTFRNAGNGVRLSIKSERNTRIHLVIAAITVLLAFLLKFSDVRFCVLILTITMVISTEMLNSAIEFTLDSVYHNKFSKMVGIAKDIAAGAVMTVSVASVLIGILLFAKPVSMLKIRFPNDKDFSNLF